MNHIIRCGNKGFRVYNLLPLHHRKYLHILRAAIYYSTFPSDRLDGLAAENYRIENFFQGQPSPPSSAAINSVFGFRNSFTHHSQGCTERCLGSCCTRGNVLADKCIFVNASWTHGHAEEFLEKGRTGACQISSSWPVCMTGLTNSLFFHSDVDYIVESEMR